MRERWCKWEDDTFTFIDITSGRKISCEINTQVVCDTFWAYVDRLEKMSETHKDRANEFGEEANYWGFYWGEVFKAQGISKYNLEETFLIEDTKRVIN